jgi:hypothetical protein
MANKTALHPSIFDIRSFQKEEKAESTGASDDEKALFVLAGLRGWTIISDFAKQVLTELDEVNSQAIATGSTFEEIGKNTIVINSVKEIVKRILNKVSDAQDAVENG